MWHDTNNNFYTGSVYHRQPYSHPEYADEYRDAYMKTVDYWGKELTDACEELAMTGDPDILRLLDRKFGKQRIWKIRDYKMSHGDSMSAAQKLAYVAHSQRHKPVTIQGNVAHVSDTGRQLYHRMPNHGNGLDNLNGRQNQFSPGKDTYHALGYFDRGGFSTRTFAGFHTAPSPVKRLREEVAAEGPVSKAALNFAKEYLSQDHRHKHTGEVRDSLLTRPDTVVHWHKAAALGLPYDSNIPLQTYD